MMHLTVRLYDDAGLRADVPLASSQRVWPRDAVGSADRPTPTEIEYALGVLASLLMCELETPKGGNRCG